MDKARMAIYSLAGLYLLFLAYKLGSGISGTEGMATVLSIIFTVLFAIIGVGAIVFSVYHNYQLKKNPPMEETKSEE